MFFHDLKILNYNGRGTDSPRRWNSINRYVEREGAMKGWVMDNRDEDRERIGYFHVLISK